MKFKGILAVVLAALAGMMVFATSASASTYCVPDYSAACPASGINEKQTDLNQALSLYGSDGNPDKVIIAPGTLTATGSFKAPGNDPLEVIGAGRDKTFLTSSATTNTYVVDFFSGSNRDITVKDLSIVVPTSFPNSGGAGSALAEGGDHFESVDFITRNQDSVAVIVPRGGSSFSDVRFFGENGASFGSAFYGYADSCGSGSVSLDGVEIQGADSGFYWRCLNVPANLNRVRITGVNNAIDVGQGAQVSVTNALIGSGEGSPIRLSTFTNKVTRLDLNHVTMVATGDASQPAIRARVDDLASPTQDIEINVDNSILTGFASPWSLQTPVGPNKGNIVMSVGHSATDAVGSLTGEVEISANSNVIGTPTFVSSSDFHLAAGSVGIDTGDPAATTPVVDLDGSLRPIDGDGDGTAVRDMGAYEYQPPDTAAPTVSKVRFRFRSGQGGSLKLNVSEASTVTAVFAPQPKGKGRKVVKLTKKAGKAGSLTFKLGKRKLKSGRYRLTIRATDTAGNKSKPVVRKIKIKR